MVEVDRVVDAGHPQGVALQVQRAGGLRDVGAEQHHGVLRPCRELQGTSTLRSPPSPAAAPAGPPWSLPPGRAVAALSNIYMRRFILGRKVLGAADPQFHLTF